MIASILLLLLLLLLLQTALPFSRSSMIRGRTHLLFLKGMMLSSAGMAGNCAVQFSSVQFKSMSLRKEKPICAPPPVLSGDYYSLKQTETRSACVESTRKRVLSFPDPDRSSQRNTFQSIRVFPPPPPPTPNPPNPNKEKVSFPCLKNKIKLCYVFNFLLFSFSDSFFHNSVKIYF